MSNSEKSPTPLERLAKEAAYFDRQADDCMTKAQEWRTLGDGREAEAESYYKQARETRAAIKTLEDAAKPVTMTSPYEELIAGHYHANPFKTIFADESSWIKKPAPKYDFKVGDRVKRVSAIGYRCAVQVEGTTGTVLEAYTGDDDSHTLDVKWDVKHSELRGSHVQNVQHAPAPKYDFKVGDRVSHRQAIFGRGTVSKEHAGMGDYSVVNVRPDSDPNVVHGWSAYNLTKIT